MDERLRVQSSKDIKSEMHKQLLDSNYDTCNLTGLLRILAKNINRIQNGRLDERINRVKDQVLITYQQFKNNAVLPNSERIVMNEGDLEAKISCYLDYVLEPRYEYVSFWEFWKTSYNLQFPCK